MKRISQRIILFDGVCNLCNGLVQFIIKRDKKAIFTLGSLQSDGGQTILKEHNLPIDDFNSFVYVKDKKVYLKSTGALHVLKDLGGAWKLFFVFIVVPRPVRDFLYNLIGKNRYAFFGKQETCMLPAPALKKRFLS